jgi:hypothetical protein
MKSHSQLPPPGPLKTLGVQLDLSPDRFGWLRDTNPNDADPSSLRSRMEADGYILLREFWPRLQVQAVRDSLTSQLESLGYLRPGTPKNEAVAVPGHEVGRAMGNPLDQRDPKLRELVYGERIASFLEGFFGGPIRHFDFVWFRAKGPGLGSPIHCDLVYMGRGTHDLYTAWVPLGDIDLDLGGLLILEDSHKKNEKLKSYLSRDVDTYCENRADAAEYASGKKWWDGTLSKNAIELQRSLGGRWLTSEKFKMGDVLLFNMTLVHGSLDNRTDRIRLSTDTRYQLRSEPADKRWIGEHPPGHSTSMRQGRVC